MVAADRLAWLRISPRADCKTFAHAVWKAAMIDDSPAYRQKKTFFARMITVYGRKPVLEALRDFSLEIYRLHLADSNKPGAELSEIETLARRRAIEIRMHTRPALARISKNARQDQGVAVDVMCRSLTQFQDWYANWLEHQPRIALLALDGISNPQNLGMIIRACCAAGMDGILLPARGAAGLNPLTIKASAGSVFRAPIIACQSLVQALQQLRSHDLSIYALQAHAENDLFAARFTCSSVFVLGNESVGVSAEVAACCSDSLAIPMDNGVESLNVAVAAALIAYRVRCLRH